ncbi:MarR family winged helix-turn-helix transcriptional regulator [Ferrimonas gelatinilytica]|uniref:MarR family transcriptional regulator n=1 Tax=Ferrimonas gelatinilytica TaxID=1255257 RepID=A0ABP9RTD0_9GAMM
MEPFNLQEFIPYRLARLSGRVSRSLAQTYRKEGLATVHWRILAQLADNPGLTAVEVGRRIDLEKSKISRALAAMEAKGWLERRRDPSDQRAAIITLTAPGWALFHRIRPMAQAWEAKLLDTLPAETRQQLLALIESLEQRLDQTESG